MTGKFKDKYNIKIRTILTVTTSVWIMCICTMQFNMLLVALAVSAVMYAVSLLLTKGSFTADENYVVFKLGLKNYTFGYYEIMSAKVKTGITQGRYGSFPHVELIITLKNGKTVTFYDSRFPKEELINTEKYKKFLDYHPFTFLCNYINERAGESDSSI